MLDFPSSFSFSTSTQSLGKSVIHNKLPIEGVSKIIVAASCKGGVGKTTITLNTAIALSQLGHSVGIFDADFYGPSIPLMTKTNNLKLQMAFDERFLPTYSNNIQTISIGSILKPNESLLWKGPALYGLISQLLTKTLWDGVDYLIIDTPPGTGDIHMHINNMVPIDGAILITSPQAVSNADVVRNIDGFKKLEIPILGIINNFDGFICPNCKNESKIFGHHSLDAGKKLAKDYGIPLISSIPIDPSIANAGDGGIPAIVNNPKSKYAETFKKIAHTIKAKVPLPH